MENIIWWYIILNIIANLIILSISGIVPNNGYEKIANIS